MQILSRRGAVRSLIRSFMVLGALAVAGCGGGGGGGSDSKPVQSLQVTAPAATAPLGSSVQLTATVTYTDQTTEVVTTRAAWTSSDATKVSVGAATGTAQAVALGTATISASFRGLNAGTAIEVTAAVLSSIAITPDPLRVGQGATQQLTATGNYTDGTKADLTSQVTWASAAAPVAAVSAAGAVSVPDNATLGGTSVITATLGSGAGAPSATSTLTVVPVGYAYVANFSEDTVSQYVIGSNGALTPLATAEVSADNSPIALAADAQGRYLYVVNNGDVGNVGNVPNGTISQYAIGLDGSLTALGSTVATGKRPSAIVVHPSGRYVYVTNRDDGTVSQYAVASNGALTALSPASVAIGVVGAHGMAIHPSGSHLYVSNGYDANNPPATPPNNVSQFSIGSDGKLTAKATPTIAAGNNPFGVAVDPLGKYLYVTNFNGDTVSQYSIAAADGALSSRNTVDTALSDQPIAVTVDPSGKYAYVTANSGNNVRRFGIGSDGTLSFLGTVATGNQPQGIAFDRGGRFAYVANSDQSGGTADSVSQFGFAAADGALTALTPATVLSGPTRTPWAVATTRAR
jgi:6-phosphogluconolactonase (cycloisomerase 2 family)